MSGLEARLVTAAVLAPAALAAVWFLPPPALAAVLAVFALTAATEWAVLVRLPVLPWLCAGLLVLLYLAGREPPWLVPGILYLAVAWWLAALAMLWRWGSAWPRSSLLQGAAGLLTLVPAWVGLMDLAGGPYGRGAVVLCLALVWAADSAAYGAGRVWGRRRLAPQISPGKTVEGAAAGLLAAGAVAVVGALLWGLSGGQIVLMAGLGCLAGAAGVVGDLTESLVKRRAGVKDSGRLLPGHGGLLDRIDALAAAAPVFALAMRGMAAG